MTKYINILELLESPSVVFYEYSADNGELLKRAAVEIRHLRKENEEQSYRIQMLEASLRNIYEEARCANVWGDGERENEN